MMRTEFDNQLKEMASNLANMGNLCEKVILTIVEDLENGDAQAAKHIAPLVEEISHKEKEIEGQCIKLLLRQQPVAKDLRKVSAALKMITDLNRIGVVASEIGDIMGYIKGETAGRIETIKEEAIVTVKMVTGATWAYVKRDVNLAKKVIKMDDDVDDAFLKVKDELVELITKNPDDGGYGLDLLMIAKYFEKIGDHAVNVAEWVIFSETGEHKSYQHE